MIPDKLFKSLEHTYNGFKFYLNGQYLESGYKPDYVLKNGNKYIIIESENSSSRKTFVGGMIKAAHFLQQEKKGMLIFVIVPKKNTTASSISIHLKPYFKWIKANTNLTSVFVIEANSYYKNKKVMDLGGSDFKKYSLKV